MAKEIREIELRAVDKASATAKKVKGNLDFTDVLKRNVVAFGAVAAASAVVFKTIQIGWRRVIKPSIDAAASVEKYEFRLNKLAGGQEAANRKLAFFLKLAGQVPATFEELIEAGVSLEAFGANSEETLELVTDLAFVMGVTIPEAAGAFGRAFAGGAGAADIFRERGILQIIKDAKGLEDLSKLTLPEFRQAMQDAFTDPQGRIAGAAKDAADTWVGAISMIEDQLFILKKTTGDVIIGSGGVKSTLTLVKILLGQINAEFQDINSTVAAVDKVLKPFIVSLVVGLALVNEQIKDVKTGFSVFSILLKVASGEMTNIEGLNKFASDLERIEFQISKTRREYTRLIAQLLAGPQDTRVSGPDVEEPEEDPLTKRIRELTEEIKAFQELTPEEKIDELIDKLFQLQVAADPVASAFQNMGEAIGDAVFQSIDALVTGQVTIKQALRNIAAEAIRAAVEESRVKAIKSLADGLAALAIGDPKAGLHFAAAAKYGLVAGIGIAAAAAISGGGTGNRDTRDNNQFGSREPRRGEVPAIEQVQDDTGTRGGNLTIKVFGTIVDWDTIWRQKIVPVVENFERDGGVTFARVDQL